MVGTDLVGAGHSKHAYTVALPQRPCAADRDERPELAWVLLAAAQWRVKCLSWISQVAVPLFDGYFGAMQGFLLALLDVSYVHRDCATSPKEGLGQGMTPSDELQSRAGLDRQINNNDLRVAPFTSLPHTTRISVPSWQTPPPRPLGHIIGSPQTSSPHQTSIVYSRNGGNGTITSSTPGYLNSRGRCSCR